MRTVAPVVGLPDECSFLNEAVEHLCGPAPDTIQLITGTADPLYIPTHAFLSLLQSRTITPDDSLELRVLQLLLTASGQKADSYDGQPLISKSISSFDISGPPGEVKMTVSGLHLVYSALMMSVNKTFGSLLHHSEEAFGHFLTMSSGGGFKIPMDMGLLTAYFR